MRAIWHWYGRRRVLTRRLLALSTAAAVIVGSLWFMPTPYYITAPGAAIDTSRMINVRGGHEHEGNLFMLVVTTRPANLLLYLYAKLDHRAVLESPAEFLGTIPDYERYMELTRRMMDDSRETAKAIALQQLGLGKGVWGAGVEVHDLLPGGAANGHLRRDDVITAINGNSVSTAQSLRAALATVKPGTSVSVTLQRNGQSVTLTVPTYEQADPARKGQAALGIFTADHLSFDLPVPVKIEPGPITGPSGGLMFTLQIIDQLTPGGITGNRVIAGTGTIEPDGTVGPIGGVQQKVFTAEAAGAELMFVPQANYEDARKVATRIAVVPVPHVSDAVRELRQLASTQQ